MMMMSRHAQAGRGEGGTFCKFTVGSSQKGASRRHLRYIANRQAVRDGKEGAWLQGFPELLLDAPYVVMVQHLCDWAHWLEQEEAIRYRGWGNGRTHYQAILSFETALSNAKVKSMLSTWMQQAFPLAQAAGFLHRNTQHLHAHLWIAARQTDGRKINLSARAFRQIDEKWNAVYAEALNRDVREHLLKKGQTKRYKQLCRAGKAREMEPPLRAEHLWQPALFTDRERHRLEEALYDSHQTRTGRDQSTPSGSSYPGKAGEQITSLGEPAVTKASSAVQEALQESEKAISDAQELHTDASRMVERQQPEPSVGAVHRRGEEGKER